MPETYENARIGQITTPSEIPTFYCVLPILATIFIYVLALYVIEHILFLPDNPLGVVEKYSHGITFSYSVIFIVIALFTYTLSYLAGLYLVIRAVKRFLNAGISICEVKLSLKEENNKSLSNAQKKARSLRNLNLWVMVVVVLTPVINYFAIPILLYMTSRAIQEYEQMEAKVFPGLITHTTEKPPHQRRGLISNLVLSILTLHVWTLIWMYYIIKDVNLHIHRLSDIIETLKKEGIIEV